MPTRPAQRQDWFTDIFYVNEFAMKAGVNRRFISRYTQYWTGMI